MAPKADMDRVQRFADEFKRNGGEWKAAMEAAGFPTSRAVRGKAGANKAMLAAVAAQKLSGAQDVIEVGRKMRADPESMKDFIIGAGVDAVMTKDSGGIAGAKLLSQWSEVADSFRSDPNITGVIILNAPAVSVPIGKEATMLHGDVLEASPMPTLPCSFRS